MRLETIMANDKCKADVFSWSANGGQHVQCTGCGEHVVYFETAGQVERKVLQDAQFKPGFV